ncbi:MAG: hypothetical protein GX843_01705 [Synergistaceae bacterium]|nr:hypothetical protein [Synergistaceae bacterium]
MKAADLFDFSFLRPLIFFFVPLAIFWAGMAFLHRTGKKKLFLVFFYLFFLGASALLAALNFPAGALAVLIVPVLAGWIFKTDLRGE